MSKLNGLLTLWTKVVLVALVAAMFWPAQSQAQGTEVFEKASDLNISSVDLDLFMVPMTQATLEELAGVWQGHVEEQIAAYVLLRASPEPAKAAEKAKASDRLSELAEEAAEVAANYQSVLSAWEVKGGDPEKIKPHHDYIKSVSSEALRVSDSRTLISLAMSWLVSDEGGLGLLYFLLFSLAVFLALILIARLVRGGVRRGLDHAPGISRLMREFVLKFVFWSTIAIGMLAALGIAGVNVTPLFAVFGGLSFILGFALQDTLGNLASGLMIMILKPFDTSDYIEVAGIGGVVDSMSVVSTQIRTFDNQFIVVPNSKIWGDVITNVSAAKTRRVDLVFGIAYSDNAQTAIEVLSALVKKDPRCLADPAPEIFVGELGDSSVNVFCRPWVKTDDYWDVYWDLTGAAKERFDQEGISIPFPQRELHVNYLPSRDDS